MKATTNMLNYALQYLLSDGYSVMPVGKNKHPLLASWKKYQTQLPTEAEVQQWWKKYPDANIGIITGKVSGITVIDVDCHKGDTTPDLSVFPETWTVRTGNGGYHLFYQYQEGITISAGAFPQFPNVDMRGDGGFVVAEPSVTEYIKDGKKVGGKYETVKRASIAPFPTDLFPASKKRRALTSVLAAPSGKRNDSIASFIGMILRTTHEDKWEEEAWPAVETANRTYNPPLPPQELRSTFLSIASREKQSREGRVVSPIQLASGEVISMKLRKSPTSNVVFRDMANVVMVLEQHPNYKGKIRYNLFKQDIELNGKTFEETDLIEIQFFMQTEMAMSNLSKDAVYAAVSRVAYINRYDEAQDWVKSLVWDGVPRLDSWVARATGVENDDYHAGIGAQWMGGMMRRIMEPGSTFDYVLVLVGPQGIGKTSFFRIIGGKWYKSYTGALDTKDFGLTMRGALVMDLDEGAALYRSEAIKIKSIITETHDEFRAPYDRVTKKYPRRFVFSMSTNDTEPFRDVTGNRRYWTIDAQQTIDFKWLEENREQLFAEAYDAYKNGRALPAVPMDKAAEKQEDHLPEDSWSEIICREIEKIPEYQCGDLSFAISTAKVFELAFPDESASRLNRSIEMRISTILTKQLGLEKLRTRADKNQPRRYLWKLTAGKAAEQKAIHKKMLEKHGIIEESAFGNF